jgi:tetratricopeptide (TPR) repeat protein
MHRDYVTLPGDIRADRRLDEITVPRSAYLLRTYLDLSDFEDGPSHASAVECACRQLIYPGQPRIMIQTHPPAGIRPSVTRECAIPQYRVRAPGDLAERLRSPRWEYLVQLMRFADRPEGLPARQRMLLATLLNTLGFHGETARLFADAADPAAGAGPDAAVLSLRHAFAVERAGRDRAAAARNLRLLVQVAGDQRGDPFVRLGALITLVVRHARGRNPDLEQVRHWRAQAEPVYAALEPARGLPDVLYASAFWRAVSYLPYLERDRERTARELDRAEHYATAWQPADDVARMQWAQNMFPLLETRMREALDFGDHDLALHQVMRLTRIEPLDPKAHLHAGDVRLARGEPQEALGHYRDAAELGAPYTSMSWFMIGHCLQALGRPGAALAAYTQAVTADPGNVTARVRVLECSAGRAGGRGATAAEPPDLSEWATSSLDAVRAGLRRNRTMTEAPS